MHSPKISCGQFNPPPTTSPTYPSEYRLIVFTPIWGKRHRRQTCMFCLEASLLYQNVNSGSCISLPMNLWWNKYFQQILFFEPCQNIFGGTELVLVSAFKLTEFLKTTRCFCLTPNWFLVLLVHICIQTLFFSFLQRCNNLVGGLT